MADAWFFVILLVIQRKYYGCILKILQIKREYKNILKESMENRGKNWYSTINK